MPFKDNSKLCLLLLAGQSHLGSTSPKLQRNKTYVHSISLGDEARVSDIAHSKFPKIWMFPETSGTPKSSIWIGFSMINHPFWGTPIFGNTHIFLQACFDSYRKHLCLSPSRCWDEKWDLLASWVTFFKDRSWSMVDSFEFYFISFLDKIKLNKKNTKHMSSKKKRNWILLSFDSFKPKPHRVNCCHSDSPCLIFNDFTISGMPP